MVGHQRCSASFELTCVQQFCRTYVRLCPKITVIHKNEFDSMNLLEIADDTTPARAIPDEPTTGTLLARALAAYSDMVTERQRLGYSAHLLTIMFHQLQGPEHIVKRQMLDEVDRIYRTFVTNVVKKPKTAPIDRLPILIGSLDLPVFKKKRKKGQRVLCNNGLHFNGLLMIPPVSRLREQLADHFRKHRKWYLEKHPQWYLGKRRAAERIDIRPMVEQTEKPLVNYMQKTIHKGWIDYDDAILVLPRSRGEL